MAEPQHFPAHNSPGQPLVRGFHYSAGRCYDHLPHTQSSGTINMIIGGTMNLSGLETAIKVEQAGAWHIYNRSPDAFKETDLSEIPALVDAMLSYEGHHSMPPDIRHLTLLLDAAAALHDEQDRKTGWLIIGVQPNQGRKILHSTDPQVPWPIYHTALCYGLGFSAHQSRSAYY